MNHSIESMLRFLHVTASGLLAGSLGFGDVPLVPGSEKELSRNEVSDRSRRYYNAIGPIALATSMTLAIGSRKRSIPRVFDVLSTLGLAGVLGTTVWVTVPLNEKLEVSQPSDYPSVDTHSLAKNFHRAHAIRTALGISAFFCAVVSNVTQKRS